MRGPTVLPGSRNTSPDCAHREDEDHFAASEASLIAFEPPYFLPAFQLIEQARMDERMDAGSNTFALVIPPASSAMAGWRSPAVSAQCGTRPAG